MCDPKLGQIGPETTVERQLMQYKIRLMMRLIGKINRNIWRKTTIFITATHFCGLILKF